VLPDRLVESAESIHVALSKPTFGVAPAEAVVLTLKEPPLAFLPQQLPVTVFEPASGQQTFTAPMHLARPLAVDTTFEIELIALTAGPGDATLESRTVTLPAGQSVLAARLLVSADSRAESTGSRTLGVLSLPASTTPSLRWNPSPPASPTPPDPCRRTQRGIRSPCRRRPTPPAFCASAFPRNATPWTRERSGPDQRSGFEPRMRAQSLPRAAEFHEVRVHSFRHL
jgi:hypothetical protein